MRRFVLILSMFLAARSMMAEGLSVDAVALPQGLQTELTIRYRFDEADVYSGYQFTMILPEGVSLVSFTEGDCYQESHQVTHNYVTGTNEDNFACLSMASDPLTGTDGVLLKVVVESDGSAEVGDILDGTIQGIVFGTVKAVSVPFSDVAFDIEITEPLIVLDETSKTVPLTTDGEVSIKVKRTIKAGEWSTICLPFSMTAEQTYEVFGEDVQLMTFGGYAANEDLTSITISLGDSYLSEVGFLANYPYIIKTTKEDITEFTVTSTIDLVGMGGIAAVDNGKPGPARKEIGWFYGTLNSGTTIPANGLFLNSNKFYYSSGKTPIMGFRGYFVLKDVLSSVDNAASAITLRIGEETTGLEAFQKGCAADGKVYDLQGRMIENPGKGMYIKNNKKIIIK